MTVQFPCDLVIAHRGKIKKRNLEPWIQRSALAVHGVEMPVNLVSVCKMFVAQQAKTMGADFIGLAQNVVRFVG